MEHCALLHELYMSCEIVVSVYNYVHLHLFYRKTLASFPGLPRFFCSSVSVDNNTRMRKGGEKPFLNRVLLSTETEEQNKKQGTRLETLHCDCK